MSSFGTRWGVLINKQKSEAYVMNKLLLVIPMFEIVGNRELN